MIPARCLGFLYSTQQFSTHFIEAFCLYPGLLLLQPAGLSDANSPRNNREVAVQKEGEATQTKENLT